jgi:hypothetical protein
VGGMGGILSIDLEVFKRMEEMRESIFKTQIKKEKKIIPVV